MTPACKDIAELLSPWIDGELDDAGRAAVAAHLAECSECNALFEKTRRMDALYAALPRAAAPDDFEDRVRAAIAAGTVAAFPRKTRMQRFWPLLMAAAIMAAFTLYFRLPHAPDTFAPTRMELSKLEAPAAAPPAKEDGTPTAELSGDDEKSEAATAAAQENVDFFAKSDLQQMESPPPLSVNAAPEEKTPPEMDKALHLEFPEPEEGANQKADFGGDEKSREYFSETSYQHTAANAAGEAQSAPAQEPPKQPAPAMPAAAPSQHIAADAAGEAQSAPAQEPPKQPAPAMPAAAPPAPLPAPMPVRENAKKLETAGLALKRAEEKGSPIPIGGGRQSPTEPSPPEAASARALPSDSLENNPPASEASRITGGDYRPEAFGYTASLGLKAYLTATRIRPSHVSADTTVTVTVSYALFGAPNEIRIEEKRSLYKDNQRIMDLAAEKGARQNGLWRSTQPIHLPAGLAPGKYSVVTEVIYDDKRLISASADLTIE